MFVINWFRSTKSGKVEKKKKKSVGLSHYEMAIFGDEDCGVLAVMAVGTHWVCAEIQDWKGLGLSMATLPGFPLCKQEKRGCRETREGPNVPTGSEWSRPEFSEIYQTERKKKGWITIQMEGILVTKVHFTCKFTLKSNIKFSKISRASPTFVF